MRFAKVDLNQKEIVRNSFGVWRCAQCQAEKPATAHQRRKTYCSNACVSAAYAKRMVGSNNPNHRDAAKRECAFCGCEYKSYDKRRSFCSVACSIASRPKKEIKEQRPLRLIKPKKIVVEKVAQSTQETCIQCGALFKKYPSQKRLFCSYQCHLDSGGAFRAGAAAKAKMKYGPKKDANHNEIFDELRKYCGVFDLSAAGCGVPDGIAWVNDAWHFFDVKNPKTGYGRAGLNKIQKKWIKQWQGGPVYLIYTEAEAKRFAHGDFTEIKREESAASVTGRSNGSNSI